MHIQSKPNNIRCLKMVEINWKQIKINGMETDENKWKYIRKCVWKYWDKFSLMITPSKNCPKTWHLELRTIWSDLIFEVLGA